MAQNLLLRLFCSCHFVRIKPINSWRLRWESRRFVGLFNLCDKWEPRSHRKNCKTLNFEKLWVTGVPSWPVAASLLVYSFWKPSSPALAGNNSTVLSLIALTRDSLFHGFWLFKLQRDWRLSSSEIDIFWGTGWPTFKWSFRIIMWYQNICRQCVVIIIAERVRIAPVRWMPCLSCSYRSDPSDLPLRKSSHR